MKKELTEQEALYKAEAYCSTTEHCLSEVSAKLEQWGALTQDIEKILARLQEERFIDEQRYACSFVRDKYRFNQWGRIKIAQQLKMKRIPEALILQAMEEIDDAYYLSILTEQLERKARSVKARNDYEKNGKLIRFAAGRGYEMGEVMECLKKITNNDVDMEGSL